VIGAKVPQAVAFLPELTRVRQSETTSVEEFKRIETLEAKLSGLESDTMGIEGMQP
jgi:hypothetical protein